MSDDKILETIRVQITYLRQNARPSVTPPAPPPFKSAMMLAENIPPHFYRYLFNAVGTPHKWVSRRYLSDDELSPLISREDVRIFVLYKEGWPAGFSELIIRDQGRIDFKFFGLVPEAQGFRLGPWFFYQTLEYAWSLETSEVRIETCTLDNPGALQLYQRMGFTPYDQGEGTVEWRG